MAPSPPINPSSATASGRSLRYRLIRGLIVVSVFYLLIAVVAMLGENYLLFHPSRFPDGNWQPIGLRVEDAHFAAADGTALHGWYIPHPNPRVHVLYAQGNAGNLTYRLDFLAQLHRLRASVFIFDYRGYGKSQGAASEPGILMDARAAREWLANRAKIDPRDIVLFGESLGGGVMVDLAAEDGARGLVLQSAFTSACDVGACAFPWLPVRWLMRTRLDSLSKIGRYDGPLLQIHGEEDTIVPLDLGQQLHAAALDRHKVFITAPKTGHNYSWPPAFVAALDQFFDRLNQTSGRTPSQITGGTP
jgi:fermentation-respiration switch protein FrsA (DUF1100 family)